MADLKITELQALAGANLAATDELAVADISASETKKITVSDLIAFGADLISNAEIPSAKISFAAGSIVEASLATGSVTATKIGADAVTAAKLGDQSTCIVAASKAALDAVTGDFIGQLGFTTDTVKIYLWQNSTWNSVKAAGSINTITADTSGIVNITVSTSGDTATVGTSLDNTGAAGQFLAGPTGSAGAVSYRTIAGADLPTATTSAKGGVIINGGGLTMSGSTAVINNTVTPVSDQLRKVSYNAQGLITASTSVAGGDLPVATSSVVGAVRPGTGLSVDGSGVLNHTNSVAGTTQNGITFDAQGHITNATALVAGDIPDLPATKLTSGTLDIARVGNNTVTGIKLANYAVTKIGETQPTADQIGQFFFNPLTRDLFLWDGNVFQPIGISVGEIIFAGTFDASAGSGSGLIATVTAEGTAIGLVVGQPLPAAATANNRYYLVVNEAGTITSGNAPNVALAPPDIVLSNGNEWTEVDVSQTITSVTANQVSYTPSGGLAAVNVQAAIDELETEKLAKAGGTMTGELLIGSAGSFAFEGSTANAYETYLTAADPTADRTITFPDQNGNVIVSGNASIVNADISATAEIAVSKLADGAARQLLQTAANGTDVEWTDNVDIPGTLDVTGAATFDSSVAVTGTLTKSGSNVVTVGDTGTVTSTMIADGTIVNADVNASAAIAGTKISPDFGSQTIATTGIVSHALGTAGAPTVTFTGDTNTGIYSPGADQVAISTNGEGRLFVAANGAVGVGTGTPASNSITVSRPSGYVESRVNSGSNTAAIAVDGTTSYIGNYSSIPLSFTTNSLERLRITSAGLVGVGTSSPTQPLDVVGNTNGSTGQRIRNDSTGASAQAVLTLSAAGRDVSHAVNYTGQYVVESGSSITTKYRDFDTHIWRNNAGTERVRIGSDGVVTIKNGAVAEIGTLTDGATITPNFASNCNFTVTLGGNRTIANPTNLTAGQSGSIFLVQDATGSRTASWGSYWDFAGGTAPTLTTTANAVDRVDYVVRSATSIHTVFTANYS